MKISYCKLWVFIITKFYRFHKTPCDPCVVTTMIHTISAIMNAFMFQPDGISFVWSTRKQCSQRQSLMILWPVTRLLCCHFYAIGRDRFQDVRTCIHAIFAACDPVDYSFVMNRNDYATIFHFFSFPFVFFLVEKYKSLQRVNFAVLTKHHSLYLLYQLYIN